MKATTYISEVERESVYTTTSEEIERVLAEETKQLNKETLKDLVISKVEKLQKNIQLYQSLTKRLEKQNKLTPEQVQMSLSTKIQLIYHAFFELQNAINMYENQKVVITFVAVGPNGEREIRIVDNDIAHLSIEKKYRGPIEYQKIEYKIQDSYQILKNTLPDEDNQRLQNTAKVATERYLETRKVIQKHRRGIVYWRTADKFKGYAMNTLGPINEAFANFYINTPANENVFSTNLEKNVETFVLHPQYGIRQADTMNGFLVGDVQKNGVQYAVKGAGGGPQNYTQIIKLLEDVKVGISSAQLDEIIANFREVTSNPKKVHSLAKEVIDDELNVILDKLHLE